MRLKKKCISLLKKCFIVLGILFSVWLLPLQGFCASPTKNYIKYDNLQVSSQILNSSGSPHNDYEIFPLQQVDTWYNYFYKLTAWPYNESYIIRVSIKDFFKSLSSDNTYHYHLTFGFIGGSTVYSKLGTTGTALVNSSSFTTSKSSVSNGDTRYIFDFDISGMSGNSDLILSFPVSASTYGDLTFLCASYGDASYYTVVTGTDKIINQFGSNYSQPNTDNQDNYNNAESQLIGGVQSTLNGVNSQWNNLNGNLLQYQGAFMAFNRFFNNLTGIPWVGTVITLSVAIGVFALLLGAVLDYAKGTQRSNARESWKAETRRYRGKMLAESQKRRKGK